MTLYSESGRVGVIGKIITRGARLAISSSLHCCRCRHGVLGFIFYNWNTIKHQLEYWLRRRKAGTTLEIGWTLLIGGKKNVFPKLSWRLLAITMTMRIVGALVGSYWIIMIWLGRIQTKSRLKYILNFCGCCSLLESQFGLCQCCEHNPWGIPSVAPCRRTVAFVDILN